MEEYAQQNYLGNEIVCRKGGEVYGEIKWKRIKFIDSFRGL